MSHSAAPVAVVQRQLEAYNARDLAAFMATYAESIRLYRLPNPAPAFESKAAMAEFYAQHRFNLRDLHAEIVNRMELGNKVIDHERVQTVDVPADDRNRFSITDADILELAKQALIIE